LYLQQPTVNACDCRSRRRATRLLFWDRPGAGALPSCDVFCGAVLDKFTVLYIASGTHARRLCAAAWRLPSVQLCFLFIPPPAHITSFGRARQALVAAVRYPAGMTSLNEGHADRPLSIACLFNSCSLHADHYRRGLHHAPPTAPHAWRAWRICYPHIQHATPPPPQPARRLCALRTLPSATACPPPHCFPAHPQPASSRLNTLHMPTHSAFSVISRSRCLAAWLARTARTRGIKIYLNSWHCLHFWHTRSFHAA